MTLCGSPIAFADSSDSNDMGEASSPRKYVSPYYFGPNAFPIPDVLEKTSDKLKLTLALDYYNGGYTYLHPGNEAGGSPSITQGRKGNTTDIMLKANIPLWTSRANLSLWWVVNEWYDDGRHRGSMSGDAYVSIDMQLLEEGRRHPSWTLRAALKSASGGGYDIGRYYDSAGYFFDTYVGKSFRFGPATLRVCGGGGFLCWQTDNGEQNDAIQYAALAGLKIGNFDISETFSGYFGWQSQSYGKDVHDCPMSLKTKITWKIKQWEVFAMMQNGLMDYPFTQLQLGTSFSIDILRKKRKENSAK